MTPRVLAICIHNSARSQMTEEYIRLYGGGAVHVESAGLEPGTINPLAAEVLLEEGIDIRAKQPRSVFDVRDSGAAFDYVIAVCDPEVAERCPIFPAEKKRLHWPFTDPSRAEGTRSERLEQVRGVREQIKAQARQFVRDELGLEISSG